MAQDLRLRARFQDPDSDDRLPDHVLRSLKLLEEWDLDVPTSGAVRSGDIAEKQVAEVEREFRRFMAIYLLAREGIVDRDPVGPSARIDAMWHNFILHTQSYVAFCEQVMGGYVHHAFGDEPVDKIDGDRMRKLLGTYFEDVDLDGVWAGDLARCWPPF